MKLLTFDYQHLDVDWISFNPQGLTDPKIILPLVYISNLYNMLLSIISLVLGFLKKILKMKIMNFQIYKY